MSRLIIDNAIVLRMDGQRKAEPGHLLIEGDRIAAVGAGPAPALEGAERIDAQGGIALPGFVDAHAHAGHALTKGLGATSDEWMRIAGACYAEATDAEFWRAEAALSALERAKCGTTTAALLFGGGPDVMRTEAPEAAEAHMDAVAAVGVAEVLAVGPNRPSGPRAYTEWTGDVRRERVVSPRAQIEVAADLIRRRHGGAGGLTRLAVSLPVFSAEDLSADGADSPGSLSTAACALARDAGVLLVQDGHRNDSIATAERHGVLPAAGGLFAHSIDLTEADIAALERSGAAVAHNPSALMSVVGRCPAPELAARGVTVALGSDAPAPDRPFDMFRIMFHAHRYHARHLRDDSVLPPWELLEMATIRGARALGLEKEIGSLETGKRADVIIVDARKPHLWPPAAPEQRLTRFANGADVDATIVAGRVLMRGRKVLSVNEDRILRDAASAYATMLERAGLSARFPMFMPGA